VDEGVVAVLPSPPALEPGAAGAGDGAFAASPPDPDAVPDDADFSPAPGATFAPSPSPEPSPAFAPSAASAAGVVLDAAARASFFAQPLPLKWMAGAVSAFLITPPHTSQAVGPVPEIECRTSTERPQDVQRYS
jgi:hypothetical protein